MEIITTHLTEFLKKSVFRHGIYDEDNQDVTIDLRAGYAVDIDEMELLVRLESDQKMRAKARQFELEDFTIF